VFDPADQALCLFLMWLVRAVKQASEFQCKQKKKKKKKKVIFLIKFGREIGHPKQA